jgi:hypothetical protein
MTESELPRYVFGASGTTLIVNTMAEFNAAIAAGWTETRDGALPIPDDDAPPTRAELEQMAAELGIKVDRRQSDETLRRRIDEALKA